MAVKDGTASLRLCSSSQWYSVHKTMQRKITKGANKIMASSPHGGRLQGSKKEK